MARWTASAKWAAGPALDGRRDMPLALRLSEGLGISARGRPTGLILYARDCASRPALRQEQEAALRLDCSAVLLKVAWVHLLLIPDARGEARTNVLIHFGLLLRSSCFRILTERGSYRRCVNSLCSITRSKIRSRTTTQRRDVARSSAALWLSASRRLAHFLLEHHNAALLMPNVRAKRATTAWRAGQQAQNGPQAQRLMASVTCRWRSA